MKWDREITSIINNNHCHNQNDDDFFSRSIITLSTHLYLFIASRKQLQSQSD